jgi:hypothetical protein
MTMLVETKHDNGLIMLLKVFPALPKLLMVIPACCFILSPFCHAHEGGHPVLCSAPYQNLSCLMTIAFWIPASAGMTK